MPFTDDEVKKILGAATPMTKLCIRLMLETGLRISDAVQFEPGKLIRGDHLWIYPFRVTKRRRLAAQRATFHEVFVSDRLKSAIDEAHDLWRSPNRPFMLRSVLAATYVGRDEMHEMDVPDCRPHRVRDSFAVSRLLAGVSIDDVSKLLGHSSVAITEAHYAPWVPARSRRLEGIVAQSNETTAGE